MHPDVGKLLHLQELDRSIAELRGEIASLPKQIAEIAGKVKAIVVVELNLGQMVREVERAVAGKAIVRFVGHAGGSVHRPEDILKTILEVAR